MRKESPLFRRLAMGSIGLHLIFGVGVARVDLTPFLPAGVWAMEEPAVIEIRFEPPETAMLNLPEPVAPKIPVSKGKRKGVKSEAPPKGRRSGGGGGDPLQRVTKMGVLGKLGGTKTGTRVASARDGSVYASDGISQLLRGVGDVRRISGSQAEGESGIGFGDGMGSGFGGGVAKQRASNLVASLGDGSSDALVLERRDGAIDGAEFSLDGADGCREEAEIARVVAKHKGGIRSCYNRLLLRSPGREGEVGVRFIISPTGRVHTVDILATTIGESEMEECIKVRIFAWKFPVQNGCETVVRYSFHFSHDQ